MHGMVCHERDHGSLEGLLLSKVTLLWKVAQGGLAPLLGGRSLDVKRDVLGQRWFLRVVRDHSLQRLQHDLLIAAGLMFLFPASRRRIGLDRNAGRDHATL